MNRAPSGWVVFGSLLFGLIFAILPLPPGVGPARPFLLAMSECSTWEPCMILASFFSTESNWA